MKKFLSFILATTMVFGAAFASGTRNIAYAETDPEPTLARVDNEIITESAIVAALAEAEPYPGTNAYAFVSNGALEIITSSSLVLPEDTKWYLEATTSDGIGNLKLQIVTDCAIVNYGIIFGNPDGDPQKPLLHNSWNFEINIAEDAELTMFGDDSYNKFDWWWTGWNNNRAALQSYSYPLGIRLEENSKLTIKTKISETESNPINASGIVADEGLSLFVSTGATVSIQMNGGFGVGTKNGAIGIENFGTINFDGGEFPSGTCAVHCGNSSKTFVVTGGVINMNCPGNGNVVSWYQYQSLVGFYNCELNIQSKCDAFNIQNIIFDNVTGSIVSSETAIYKANTRDVLIKDSSLDMYSDDNAVIGWAENITIQNSIVTARAIGTGADCDGIYSNGPINIDGTTKLYVTGVRSIVAKGGFNLPSGIGFLGSATQNDAVVNLTQAAKILDKEGKKIPYIGTSISDPVAKTVIIGSVGSGDPTPSDPAPINYYYYLKRQLIIPVFGDENRIKVDGVVDGTRATLDDISDEDINKVIGSDVETGIVHIDLANLKKPIKKAVIPMTTIDKIAAAIKDSNNDAIGLEVDLSTAKVRFDAAATLEIASQAKGSKLWLVVDDIKENSLNKAQKETTSQLDVALVIDAYLVSDGLRLCTAEGDGLGLGKARVALPYELKEGETPAIYTVYYLDDEGGLHVLDAVYNIDEECFEFDLEHFSNYIVAYTKEGEESFAYMKCPQDETCVIDPFWDSDPMAWYHDGVHYCIENGLMVGYPGKAFGPLDSIKRGEIAMTLWRIDGCPVVSEASEYDDVSADLWYADAVRWATAMNIMEGLEDGLFHGEKAATREDIAKIIYSYAQTKGQYIDGDDAVNWCTENEIMKGTADGSLELSRITSRAEAAAMFQRTRELIVFGR